MIFHISNLNIIKLNLKNELSSNEISNDHQTGSGQAVALIIDQII